MLIQSHIMIMVWDSYGSFSKEYVGLFASLGAKAEVKNLGMVDVDIDLSSSYFVGAIAGYASGTAVVSNCYVSGAAKRK